jgi:hypothetical protein
MKARIVSDPRMNETERLYAGELEKRRLTGHIKKWVFEGVKFRLADNTFYTPDFWVVDVRDYVTVYEIKGFWRDDARVKWKAIADLWPEFMWVAVRRVKGQWKEEVYR